MPEGQKPPVQEGESLEDIKRKYAESSTEGKRLAARVRQLEEEKRQVELRQVPQTDPDEAALEEAGVDTGALRRFMARQQAELTQQSLQPVIVAAQAEQAVPTELRPKVQALFASNPDLLDTYNAVLATGNSKAAADFISRTVRAHDAEAGMHEEGAAAKAQRETERRDAAIAGAAGGRGTTDESEAEQAAERRQKLREAGQAMGGFNKALASEFFKGKIKVIHNLTDGPTTI